MGKKDKTTKVTDGDRASVAASSFNAASAIVASTLSGKSLGKTTAAKTMDLTQEFYELRIAWMEDAGIGGAPKSTGGGGGGNYKPSGGSKRSSGGPKSFDEPSLKMIGFYGDLITGIEEAGGEAALSIKKFKKLNGEDASEAIDEAIETRDNLK